MAIEIKAATLVVRHSLPGVQWPCSKCGVVLKTGHFFISFENDEQTCLVAESQPMKCCEAEQRVPMFFGGKDAAHEWVVETLDDVNRVTKEMHMKGSVDHAALPKLSLLPVTLTAAPAVQ